MATIHGNIVYNSIRSKQQYKKYIYIYLWTGLSKTHTHLQALLDDCAACVPLACMRARDETVNNKLLSVHRL